MPWRVASSSRFSSTTPMYNLALEITAAALRDSAVSSVTSSSVKRWLPRLLKAWKTPMVTRSMTLPSASLRSTIRGTVERVAHVEEGDVLLHGARVGHRVVDDDGAAFAEHLSGGALRGAHAEDADLFFGKSERRPLGHQLAAFLIVQHQDGLLRADDHGHFLHETPQRGFQFGRGSNRRPRVARVLQFRF